MNRSLIVTWDGAGNLVPTLALARRLALAGHDVRVLGHRSIQRRYGSPGWRLRPFVRTMDVDSAAAAEGEANMLRLARDLWFGAAVADDVREELAREPADVVIADCMLFGALSAAQAAGVRTVALFHAAFAIFRTGPFADLLGTLLPELNRLRASLGLESVARISDLHDACALSLVATPREFEPPIPIPPNVRFAGPMLDAPPLLQGEAAFALDSARAPSIVVSLSTSNQGQLPLLQRVVAALAAVDAPAVLTTGPAIDPASLSCAGNVRIARFIPHDRLLPQASLVVTHAGLGTVMASLTHGVPLLCLPLGRDQFFNAARVEGLGLGKTLPSNAEPDAMRAAMIALLGNEHVRASAKAFSRVIAVYGNGAGAVEAVQHLAPA